MVYRRLAALGVAVPQIELPAPGVDTDRWGVVAVSYTHLDVYKRQMPEGGVNSGAPPWG